MKSNAELQTEVKNAFKWEPLLNASEIEVTAKDGIVFLKGLVDSYTKKMKAENAAKKVRGIKAVVEQIEVKFPYSWSYPNAEIADKAALALKSSYSIPDDKVTIKVEDGWVTLEGELPYNYQKEAAEKAVNQVTGVIGIINNIKIRLKIHDKIEQQDIEKAIGRCWSIDDNGIHVRVSGTTVTLTGMVTSWYQKEEVGRIAWNTPGIENVQNDLAVDCFSNE